MNTPVSLSNISIKKQEQKCSHVYFFICVYLLCKSYTNLFGIKSKSLIYMKLKKGDPEVTEPLCKHATKWFFNRDYKQNSPKKKKKSSLKEFQEGAMLMMDTGKKSTYQGCK